MATTLRRSPGRAGRPQPPPAARGVRHPEESRSDTLLDTLRVAVVMLDTSGRVLLWSPLRRRSARLGGRAHRGPQGGRPVRRRRREPSAAGHGADRPRRPARAEQILAELLRGGRWDGVLSLRHRDGHTVLVETRASLLVDGDGRPFVLASMVETSRLRSLEQRARRPGRPVRLLAAGRGHLRQRTALRPGQRGAGQR